MSESSRVTASAVLTLDGTGPTVAVEIVGAAVLPEAISVEG